MKKSTTFNKVELLGESITIRFMELVKEYMEKFKDKNISLIPVLKEISYAITNLVSGFGCSMIISLISKNIDDPIDFEEITKEFNLWADALFKDAKKTSKNIIKDLQLKIINKDKM